MTGAEVKKLTSEEVGVELKRLREKLFQLRNQAVTEKVEDTSQFRKIRKDIARLLTEQNARARATAGKKA
ncbi:MAG: 50S ribosomal protein L29 [Planctomycetaceae bacterium]|jgi:large subunit ribosomal protein L29|nr:50S ribosomal protein L29 [Phycisphaerales bacterium]MCE2652317.1 50S ribosomal protein L29 [Planctomycetaceae bacterium]